MKASTVAHSGMPFHVARMPAQSHPEKRTPLPHQSVAVKDFQSVLLTPGNDVRAQGAMACGTGKTLVGLWTSEGLGPRTLLTEPSRALVAQNLREWRANFSGPPPEILVVCSDQSVVRPNADEVVITAADLGIPVTTSADEVAAFLRGTSSKKLLVSTLHSTPIVAKAMTRRGIPRFDCIVVDEAHRTATDEESAFTTPLHQDEIPSRTRLFLTATPRIYREGTGGDDKMFSMDDETVYGRRAHTLGFRRAVEMGLLCDYQVVVPLLLESDFKRMKRRGGAGDDVFKQTIAEVGFLRAATEYGLSKVVTFHSSIARSNRFARDLPDVAVSSEFTAPLWINHVSGAMPSRTRDGLLDVLKTNNSAILSVLSNCRCLTEGVDVPALDGIVFFDPRSSEIDLIQAIGRVMRRAKGKSIGTIVIPVVVTDSSDPQKALAEAGFGKLWRVLRALRAIDDALEVRCRALLSGGRGEKGGGKLPVTPTGNPDLIKLLGAKLQTRVIQSGLGITGSPLTEEVIVGWARAALARNGSLPTQDSGKIFDADGTDTGENWSTINAALRSRARGLAISSSLPDLLERHGLKQAKPGLTEEKIVAWANLHLRSTGSPPTLDSGAVLDENGNDTGENWRAIDAALGHQNRGLLRKTSLHQLLIDKGLKVEKVGLSETLVIQWAKLHKRLTGKLPTKTSGAVLDATGKATAETWGAVGQSMSKGVRGFTRKITLAELYVESGLRKKKSLLTENQIVAWAKLHKKQNGRLPTKDSGAVLDKDGKPTGATWKQLDMALRAKKQGLPRESSLPDLYIRHHLKKERIPLSEALIVSWARAHLRRTGNLPSQGSGTVLDEGGNDTGETWSRLDQALRSRGRGLPNTTSLPDLFRRHGVTA